MSFARPSLLLRGCCSEARLNSAAARLPGFSADVVSPAPGFPPPAPPAARFGGFSRAGFGAGPRPSARTPLRQRRPLHSSAAAQARRRTRGSGRTARAAPAQAEHGADALETEPAESAFGEDDAWNQLPARALPHDALQFSSSVANWPSEPSAEPDETFPHNRSRPADTGVELAATRNPLAKKFQTKLAKCFLDRLELEFKAGSGGDGCIAFHRDRWIRNGPPSGGNGGRGGNVVLKCDARLLELKMPVSKADGGRNGEGECRIGRQGPDLVLHVPQGTVVTELALDEAQQAQALKRFEGRAGLVDFKFFAGWIPMGDGYDPPEVRVEKQVAMSFYSNRKEPLLHFEMMTDGETRVVARGGVGGLGNASYATKFNKGPKFASLGLLGEIRRYALELKTIADAGLVGLPNAGKSTFLAAISNALPKVAPYPFTTLNPYLGTVDYPDSLQITVADIPGLVAGAHRNVGLGHSFLRHVERSKVLIYVVDVSGPAPWDDLAVLQNELELYLPGLSKRPSLVVANKADRVDAARPNLEELRRRLSSSASRASGGNADLVLPVSAKHKKNIVKFMYKLRELVSGAEAREAAAEEEEEEAGGGVMGRR